MSLRLFVQALVCSRLDYCNTPYYELPNTQIQRSHYLTQLLKPKTLSCHNLKSNAILNNLEKRDSKLCCGGDRVFYIEAPREWNKMPANTKSFQSIEMFKSKLKTYLFNECFNSDI